MGVSWRRCRVECYMYIFAVYVIETGERVEVEPTGPKSATKLTGCHRVVLVCSSV